jgi:hypothetical protein
LLPFLCAYIRIYTVNSRGLHAGEVHTFVSSTLFPCPGYICPTFTCKTLVGCTIHGLHTFSFPLSSLTQHTRPIIMQDSTSLPLPPPLPSDLRSCFQRRYPIQNNQMRL